ncbi:MAG: AMP-binding protein, partial [Myxococcales bacterium]|nr:AMP-binding protein [Myxococcales bacterium]
MIETGLHLPVTVVASEARSLGEMFRLRARRSGDAAAIFSKDGAGRWQETSWRGFYEAAARVAAGLDGLGLALGDKVAILGDTKAPWAIHDMGAQLGGYVTLGIYPKQTVEQVAYLLDHSDARVVTVDSEPEARTVLAALAGGTPNRVVAVIPWTAALYERLKDADPRVTSPSVFEGAPLSEAAIDKRLDAIEPDDTAIFIYTSGTTGPPKGAMIAHRSILALLASQEDYLEFFQDDVSLSFLPMAHAAERVLAFYGRISTGVATAYASSTAAVLEELREVGPTLFGSVPRIFEKAHAKVYGELEKKPAAVRRLFAWAVKIGTERVRRELAGEPLTPWLRAQDALADRLVWKKVRAAFGGRIRFFVTGAAPIARQILEFFWAARLPIFEAYGMTEATVITHINRPGGTRLGSVGQIIAPMEQRLADDGEILLRGPFLFKGYYKD